MGTRRSADRFFVRDSRRGRSGCHCSLLQPLQQHEAYAGWVHSDCSFRECRLGVDLGARRLLILPMVNSVAHQTTSRFRELTLGSSTT